MVSVTHQRDVGRAVNRQRRRYWRRAWRWLLGDTLRGVRFAYREFRDWLNEPTETLP